MLNQQQLLHAPPKLRVVPTESGDVQIRVLSGFRRDLWFAAIDANRIDKESVSPRGLKAALATLALAEAEGAWMFGVEAEERMFAETARVVNQAVSEETLDAIYDAAMAHSHLRAEDTETAAKNSSGGPSAASGSSSPAASAAA